MKIIFDVGVFLRKLFCPLLSRIVSIYLPYKVVIEQPCCPVADGPVIYVANHFCFADVPIMGMITPTHSYILMGKQRLRFVDRLYCMLNGAIWVDRQGKMSKEAAKKAITIHLKNGRSVIIFPEGTWNLTEHLLMLPMKWGIVDIAKETGAKIIPVALEYDREKKTCFVQFGTPMSFLLEDDKSNAISTLRDTLATMRWMFWERKGVFSRRELNISTERQKQFYSVEEYPPIEWDYECSCIYHPYFEPKEAFAHLQQLIPNRENAFLFRERYKFTGEKRMFFEE